MNMNRKHSAQRTIAGILAAITVMTAIVPAAVGAEEVAAEQETLIVSTETADITENAEDTAETDETPTEETTEATEERTEEFTEADAAASEVVAEENFAENTAEFAALDTFAIPSEAAFAPFAGGVCGVNAKEFGKQAGIDLGDAALDTIGDLFPGANILVSPFKTLFHANVDDPDPMTMICNKLDQMDNKLDEIQTKLEDLDSHIDENTEWMGKKMENVADMSALMNDYRELSPRVEDFIRDIRAAEENPDCNNVQKIMRLAQLKNGSNYREINQLCNKIKKYMNSSSTQVFPSLYETLYQSKAMECMVESEAYQEALPVAEDLTSQYVYAVLLLAECQRAADAVCRFTAEDVEALGNGIEKRYFEEFDIFRQAMDTDSASEQLAASADGVTRFRSHENSGTLIFKNKKSVTVSLRNEAVYQNGQKEDSMTKGHIVNIPDIAKDNALTCDEIKEIADYVRSKYPNTCLMDFFKRFHVDYREKFFTNAGRHIKIDRTDSWQTYVLTSTDAKTTEKYNTWHGLSTFGGAKDWTATVTIKGISLTDPNCEEQEIKLYTYNIWRYYAYGIQVDTDKCDYTYYGKSILYIDRK